MPTQNTTISPLTTVFLIFLFLIGLFPSLFHSIVWAPYHLIFRSSTHSAAKVADSVHCTPPSICTPPQPQQQHTPYTAKMSWTQKTLTLPPSSRGSYLITDSIVSQLPEIKTYKTGLLHLFMQHTSAALSLNENWDEDVRADMSDALDRIVEEDKGARKGLYRHSAEGSDDMPAHIKSALIGASVTIPITNGRLATGTWQGIWYLEFRAARHTRKVVATIQGEKM
ncbi:UPF0047-domain-containing protein [Westerdykella ornata]|uniref:UPF0047-domain-containing protein n=1 Tax=Westerdykella ornata TaxID=318751 RepID=A0A6A6JUH0_WESOR|nr:UPF0047-domain-containing protein [Westerdykella ornata]KAF2279895.1 UPF0047-domain-containing protein [Westerdykella ornata]